MASRGRRHRRTARDPVASDAAADAVAPVRDSWSPRRVTRSRCPRWTSPPSDGSRPHSARSAVSTSTPRRCAPHRVPRPLRRPRPVPRRRPSRQPGGQRLHRRLTVVTKPEIVDALEDGAPPTLGLLDPVPPVDQARQVSPLMSPLCWDLAHIGHYEELWLIRELTDAEPSDALRRHLRRVQAPAPERRRVAISIPSGARRSIADVRKRALDVLDGIALDPRSPCSPTASSTAWSCNTSISTTRRCSPRSS